MYDDILLPVEGSDAATAATSHAAELATTYDATVHVLAVADTRNRFESPTSGLAPDAWDEAQHENAREAAAAATAALPDGVAVEEHLAEGIPEDVILDRVGEHAIDLVVMGTHGRTGLDHYLIGSVTEDVVRKSSAPVLTVRLDAE
ncbi:universal stress protein [Halosegnis marinus]|uniref:Universal stress protein n=1 Tax=Halosegnis marinus TaxID=3034023 RepID=A0ABD5ZP00_9EURY|nr:universal stress protein [Halosegnis sp. DT85]